MAEESKIFMFKNLHDTPTINYFEEQLNNYLNKKKVDCDFLLNEKKSIANFLSKILDNSYSLSIDKHRFFYKAIEMFYSCSIHDFLPYLLSKIYKRNQNYSSYLLSSFLSLLKNKDFKESISHFLKEREYLKELIKIIYESGADVVLLFKDELEKIAFEEIDEEQIYAIRALSLIEDFSSIVDLMEDWDDQVRVATIEALASTKNKKAAQKAISLYLKENNPRLKALLRQIITINVPKKYLIEHLLVNPDKRLIRLLIPMLSRKEALELAHKLPIDIAKYLLKFF